MAMMTDKEKEKWKMVGIIAVIIIAGYLVLAYANFIPADYNVFEYGKEEVVPTPTPTHSAGEGYISGIPTEVNITDFPEFTINITTGCNESWVGGFTLNVSADDSDTDVWFTADTTDWQISDDGLEATYIGDDLSGGVVFTTLHLNMDNTDLTEASEITITADASLGELDEDEFTVDLVL
jgi:hypothetical protein